MHCTFALAFGATTAATALAQAAAAPRQSGTVKSATADSLVLTTTAGQDFTVAVPAAAKVLIVAPGSHDLSSATPGALTDVQAGDRVLVTGTQGDTPEAIHAARVILMKSTAIAETHAAEEAAWARGGGGIVKSVDTSAGNIVVSSGLRTVTIKVQPSTVLRRYSGDSVRFSDAKPSTIAEVHAGDQLRVRGTRSADGTMLTADEIVTGTFRNYSGLLSAVDSSAGTVTLKDLTTKKTVVVSVTQNSDVRRIPPTAAQMIASHMRATTPAPANGAGRPAGAAQPAPGAPTHPPSDAPDAQSSAAGARRAGMDLSQMLSRLPTETITGLKPGDAVMIVATSPSADSDHSSAVTLLAGVEPILSASPSGQSMTLSPWSVGGSGDAAMGGEGGGPGR